MGTNEILTLAEAAAECRCSVQTIRRQIQRGELETVIVGARGVRIPAEALATRQRMSAPRHARSSYGSYATPTERKA
jgi:excisionase family DNA binding protein